MIPSVRLIWPRGSADEVSENTVGNRRMPGRVRGPDPTPRLSGAVVPGVELHVHSQRPSGVAPLSSCGSCFSRGDGIAVTSVLVSVSRGPGPFPRYFVFTLVLAVLGYRYLRNAGDPSLGGRVAADIISSSRAASMMRIKSSAFKAKRDGIWPRSGPLCRRSGH